jgi:putative transposase
MQSNPKILIATLTLMSLWQLYYHFVWATKDRLPLISPDKESHLYDFIIGKSDSLGAIVYAINGTDNHIHLVASVPPTIALSEFIKRIKGSSSHDWNQNLAIAGNAFAWQGGYGVFSFGQKQLDWAIAYVQNQKIHHQNGSIVLSLEKDSE